MNLKNVLIVPLTALFLASPAFADDDDDEDRKASSSKKSYYLTSQEVLGDDVLFQCRRGFHFASIWEIRDTSNLKYNTRRGYTTEESGFGPPAGVPGWLRSGLNDGRTCENWTAAEGFLGPIGQVAPWELYELPHDQGGDGWDLNYHPCWEPLQVWCVSN